MKDVIDKATVRALEFNSDGATQTFYAKLRERSFQSTRCAGCAKLAFPPRPFCPGCGHGEVEWVDLPKRGKLYAFTQQHRSLRFFTPDVLGLVELQGTDLVLTKIDAPLESLSIGQEVELDFCEVSKDLVVHQFRPIEAQ